MVFGSVASKGLTDEILEVWQGKNLAVIWPEVRRGRSLGIRVTGRREDIEQWHETVVPDHQSQYTISIAIVK
jgi:hypothetical protein